MRDRTKNQPRDAGNVLIFSRDTGFIHPHWGPRKEKTLRCDQINPYKLTLRLPPSPYQHKQKHSQIISSAARPTESASEVWTGGLQEPTCVGPFYLWAESWSMLSILQEVNTTITFIQFCWLQVIFNPPSFPHHSTIQIFRIRSIPPVQHFK